MSKTYETVIGLEVHVELATKTKIFCSCTTAFGGAPNSHCCPVCIGLPGTLPKLNREVVNFGIKAGLATHGEIAEISKMDRKNYCYPDLSKAYQISQLYAPLSIGGYVELSNGRKIRLHHIHIEEDAGKLIHQHGDTYVDYNRGGVPLIEIVSEPDIRSIDEAKEYVEKLQQVMRYIGISDCRMQEGSMRCDVNISVRPEGSETLGTRTEIKNMNSITNIAKAMEYEYERQVDLIESGGKVVQETLRYDDATNTTSSMRSKEDAHDYRYFRDPDLVTINVPRDVVESLKAEMPELPSDKCKRYIEELEIPEKDAQLLTKYRKISEFFDKACEGVKSAKSVSNFIIGQIFRRTETEADKETFDVSGFDKIMVPGHIELAGYDKIRYINTMYPWEGKEYHRGAYSMQATGTEEGMFSEAQYNPVGSYIKYFDLDKNMCGKRIHICFEGVEEAMYLWLNGQFIGYAEDSFTPSEFDLTPYIKEKGNVLAVQVHKMSTAAFLEDQDFFRFFGIFRNVTLKAVPEVHLEDVWFQPTLNKDNASGRVSVKIKVTAPEGRKVAAHFVLKDRENNQVAEDNITLEEKDGSLVGVMDTEVGSVKAWDNHCPYLYHAYVELRGEDGEILEIIPYDIGFRRLEMIDKVIYLNGKRLVITGVNRHEWSAKTGRSISMNEMTADIDCMIRNNINAVRTCHYPDQIPWYYLCDKAGIYVMAETNMESHGTFQKLGAIEPSCSIPCSIPQWREAVVDRARSNFETFKNHTAILFWSLGNESYAGDDIEAMNTYFKEKQDGRFVHYESSFYDRNYEETISDVESRMYAKPYEVEEYLNNNPKKPYLLCEYMHDMGNSMGGLGTYMKLIDKYEMYHGGFIWDFIDQALLVKDEVTGKEVLRYGGDFDDKPSDYEFSGNGIVFADRKEKPAMQEVRYYYGLYR